MQSVSETYILECFRNKLKDLTLRTAAERQSCDGFKQLYCAGQPTSSTSSGRTVSLICSNLGVWLPSAGGVQTLHYTRPALADVRPTPLSGMKSVILQLYIRILSYHLSAPLSVCCLLIGSSSPESHFLLRTGSRAHELPFPKPNTLTHAQWGLQLPLSDFKVYSLCLISSLISCREKKVTALNTVQMFSLKSVCIYCCF